MKLILLKIVCYLFEILKGWVGWGEGSNQSSPRFPNPWCANWKTYFKMLIMALEKQTHIKLFGECKDLISVESNVCSNSNLITGQL